MFRNLFAAAVVAALCAGLLFTLIQQVRLTPLIIAAESFEGAPEAHTHAAEAVPHTHEDGTVAHSHGDDEWMPQDGIERTGYTVLANVLAAAGYALVIGAVALLAGLPINGKTGFLWGIGGYAAFSLAPAFGLPPGLPGMAVADTLARQVWWWSAAIATGAGLLAVARWRTSWAVGLAAVLIALPHVIGAPQPPDEATAVPANLAVGFAAAVLFANAAMWVALGVVFGFVADRLAARSPGPAVAGATV
ncbi:MAG TPA: CbtA family protein [Devosiaceae bacterium]|jgi:cobalt transporter subunit CbtA|nr:CbtA family protein [Devosiaceae bacterium]